MASFSKGTVSTTDNNDPCPCGVEGCNAPPPPPNKYCKCGLPMHVHLNRHRSKDVNFPHIGGVCRKCAEKATAPRDRTHQLWLQKIIKDYRPKDKPAPFPVLLGCFGGELVQNLEIFKSYSAQRIFAMRADEWPLNTACQQAFVGHELEKHTHFAKMLDGAANPKPAGPPPAKRYKRMVQYPAFSLEAPAEPSTETEAEPQLTSLERGRARTGPCALSVLDQHLSPLWKERLDTYLRWQGGEAPPAGSWVAKHAKLA